MSTHHWIHNHCTKCGVKREKVRVQGPCREPAAFEDADIKAMLWSRPLFLSTSPMRSIEPHKKRREK